ncbi:aldose epimerase [Actinophytocola xinjiangensis]|uniref:Aldose epimerase n=1 Tax=Actinophytocola xinjiangensis TaxID=485602 RepID=A0A7Z1AXJ4_9PSEU|nr:aldose 1-epimerase family protein [Actinophytocola xinjiangensis]OLF09301.1 aldose epimerase [Actinophytocola xinjiangensis]
MGPTGRQLEIGHGDARATVTTVGASLRAFEVAGQPYVETYGAQDSPPLGAGAVLVPWPNRVRGGTWPHAGVTQQLEVTEPARGNAIHGLTRREEWTVVEHTASALTLEVRVDGRQGWPFGFATGITYAVDQAGLTVTHTVHNLSDDDMPFGVGAHPYPRPAGTDVDDCVLTLAASTVLPVDEETLVPVGKPTSVEGTDLDFRAGRPLRTADLDTAFGGCLPGADGLVHHTVTHDGGGVEVWADPVFAWVQVFTPTGFPGSVGRAIAIEPMTCPPDALNSGTDLIVLPAGGTWSGRWGIRALGR